MVVFAQLHHSRFWYGAGVKRAMVRGSCGALLPEGSHRTSLCSASTKEAGLVAGCAPQAAPSPRGRSWRRSDPVSGTAVQAGWLYCCLKLKFKGRSSKLQDVCVSHWDGGSSSGAERARHWGMSWRKLDLGTSCLPNCWSSIEGFSSPWVCTIWKTAALLSASLGWGAAQQQKPWPLVFTQPLPVSVAFDAVVGLSAVGFATVKSLWRCWLRRESSLCFSEQLSSLYFVAWPLLSLHIFICSQFTMLVTLEVLSNIWKLRTILNCNIFYLAVPSGCWKPLLQLNIGSACKNSNC